MLNYTEFDKRMLVVNRIIIGFLVVITLLPLIYVLVASFMDPTTLLNKGISFNPKDWTLTGYERVFADGSILRGFLNSIFYSVTFSVLTVFITMITAYPLSKANLVGKGPIMTFLIITMFFGGGLVPTYLLLKNMNMIILAM